MYNSRFGIMYVHSVSGAAQGESLMIEPSGMQQVAINSRQTLGPAGAPGPLRDRSIKHLIFFGIK